MVQIALSRFKDFLKEQYPLYECNIKPKFITKDMVKPGAVVVDVGINRVDGKIVGDVSPDVAEVAGYMTPVPGGVGPVTVAYLIENVLDIEFNKENNL